MSTRHSGNGMLNEITFEEHDGTNNAKRVNLVSGATIFAVVNTSAAGQASVRVDGNVTLSDAKTYIGLTTTTLGASPAFIGIVTVANAPSTGNITIAGTFASRATQANASIGTTPVQLLGSDVTSFDTLLFNISNTTIFVANTTGACNASLGIPVFLNDSFSYGKLTAPIFAVANAGSGEVRFWRSLA